MNLVLRHESSPNTRLSDLQGVYPTALEQQSNQNTRVKRRDGGNMAAFVSEGCGEGRKP